MGKGAVRPPSPPQHMLKMLANIFFTHTMEFSDKKKHFQGFYAFGLLKKKNQSQNHHFEYFQKFLYKLTSRTLFTLYPNTLGSRVCKKILWQKEINLKHFYTWCPKSAVRGCRLNVFHRGIRNEKLGKVKKFKLGIVLPM